MMNRNSIRRVPESKKIMAAIIACVIVIAAVLGVVLFTTGEASAYSQKLKLAEQYVMEGDLDAAEIQYQELINLYPKREQAYIDLAEKVYVRQNRYAEAYEILKKGQENTGKDKVFEDTVKRIGDQQKESEAWKSAYREILSQYADGIYEYENFGTEYWGAREGTALCDLNEDGVDELLFFTMDTPDIETLHIFTFSNGAAREITYEYDSTAGNRYEGETGNRFEAIQVAGGSDYIIYKEKGQKGFTTYANISDESIDCTTNRYEMDAACNAKRTALIGMWFLLFDSEGTGKVGEEYATYYKDHKECSRDEYYGIMDPSIENVQTVIFRFNAAEWINEDGDDIEYTDHPSLWENTEGKAISLYYEDMMERLQTAVAEEPPTEDSGQSEDGKNMEALLDAYSDNDFETALSINEKLSPYVTEMDVSEKEAEAFETLFYDKVDQGLADDEYTLHYITDIDNDGKAEFLLQVGTCEADYMMEVYQYRDGKTSKVGEVGFGHSMVCQYPDHNGVIIVCQHMGGETLSILWIENGELKANIIGGRYEITDADDYIDLGCALDFYEY